MRVPVPKKKNIILALPENTIKISEEEMNTEVEAEVAFKGSEVEYYEVGDKVLFNKNKATKIKFFKKEYWKTSEDYIICGIEDGSSV